MAPAPVAISCGEPAGIGPEIAVKAWAALGDALSLLWIGEPAHLPPGTPFTEVSAPEDTPRPGTLAVLPVAMPGRATPGRPAPGHAPGVVAAIETGARLALEGRVRALVTAPVSKKALIDGANFVFPGHTEFLADIAGVGRVVMMLAGPDLRVVPATIHIPLADVPGALTEALVVETVEITARALVRDFGIPAPRIAVAGLNPHAGEGGAMGREEIEVLAPALATLREKGFDVTGPLPADTMFHPRARARYDAAVTIYHDQALVPLKTIAFDEGVNVTLGLPFVHTSPDHGTAFDIAGTGAADATSMIAAIRLADAMARARE